MKILQLTNKVPFPATDGGTLAMHNLAMALTQEGHSVTVLSMVTQKHHSKIEDIPEDVKQQLNYILVEVDTGINAFSALRNLLFSKNPYNAERFIDAGYRNRLEAILKSSEFDIVQLEGIYLAPYINTIREFSTAKIALRAHNLEHEIWHRYYQNEQNKLKRWYLRLISRRLCYFERKYVDLYDFLVPITSRDAESFDQMGNTKPVHVCPYGIAEQNICSSTEIRSLRKLFFLGSLDWLPNQEGLEWFIDKVWPQINTKNDKLEFHIAGRGAPEDFVKKLQRPGIVYHGKVESASQYTSQYDILIAPLFSGSGMRVKLIEAMSAGKAIVTTSIGAEGIEATHNEHMVISDDVTQFSLGVEKLLDNTDFFVKLGENSIALIREKYNIRTIANKLDNFYKSHC